MLLLAAVVVFIAAITQTITGSGFGVVAAPGLLIVMPELVPGSLLVITIIVLTIVIYQDRQGLQNIDLRLAMFASTPGAIIGLWILALASRQLIAAVVGSAVLISVIAVSAGWKITPSSSVMLISGGLAGVLSTIASSPGPPVLVTYRADEAIRYRANLALFYLFSSAAALLVLFVSGTLVITSSLPFFVLLPVIGAGTLVGAQLARKVSAHLARNLALGLCALSGVGLLIKAMAV